MEEVRARQPGSRSDTAREEPGRPIAERGACVTYECMTEVQPASRDYMIPEGCPVCAADLPVRVTQAGPNGVCKHCGWLGRPILTVTHQGLRISYEAARA